MLKKFTNKKGFTLMEMLIVVAIIAILIAIAIPTFTGAMNKANAATDLANIRSGYAQAQIRAMTEGLSDNTKLTLKKDGSVDTGDTNKYVCKGSSTDADGLDDFAGGSVTVSWGKGDSIEYTITGGKVSSVAKK